MLDKIKSLGKQTAVYGFGSILNKMLGFILIPIYQTHIPIGDFGYLVYFETIILFLSSLLNYGIGPAHQRFFYIEREKNTYGVYLFNNFFGCFILALASILPMLIFSGTVSEVITGSKLQSGNFQITLWIVLIEILYVIPFQYLQYEKKPVQYLLFNVFKLAITFSITIYFVVSLSMGFQGMLLARLIGGLAALLIGVLFIIIPQSKFRIDIESLKQSLRFGFPYVVSTIGYTLFTITDRFMLNWLSTPEELGKYGFGFRIANFINLIFVQTIGLSYFPSIMDNEKKANNIRYYRKMLTYYCFLLAFLILGFLFFYKDILWVVGKQIDYWDGLKVVPVLSLSFMIMGMNYFVGVGLFLNNKTKEYILPSFSAVCVNIIMNLFLIPRYGIMGAAYSVVAAQVIYISFVSILSAKYMKVNFEWGKIMLIYLIGIAIFLATELFPISNLGLSWLLKIILLGIFPIILLKLNFFEQIEIDKLKAGVYKVGQRFKLVK